MAARKAPLKRSKAQRDAEKSYDATKRRGAPVSTRLDDDELAHLDAVRGTKSRSAWLGALIRRELRRNS